MNEVSASEFKVHCLRLMEQVRKERETLVITRRGIPIAKLVPIEEEARVRLGGLADKLEIVGDIVSPAIPEGSWSVMLDDAPVRGRAR
jgi:prevent-host-death family protein